MSNPSLKKIIKLTQSQYDTLASGGTVGDFTGLNDNYLYLIQDNTDHLPLLHLTASTQTLVKDLPHGSYAVTYIPSSGGVARTYILRIYAKNRTMIYCAALFNEQGYFIFEGSTQTGATATVEDIIAGNIGAFYNYLDLEHDQTITGTKTFNSPVNIIYSDGDPLYIETDIENGNAFLNVHDSETDYEASFRVDNSSDHAYTFPDGSGTIALTDDIINVVANPGSTTATLSSITIGETNYAIQGGVTDVKINNTSILSNTIANFNTKTAYNALTNKIVTESDLPKIRKFI